MFLMVQLSWIAIQKWQFNHFAAYSARVWSVNKDDSAEGALLKVQAVGVVRWDLIGTDYVRLMWVSDEGQKDYDEPAVTADGITYTGIAALMSIYRDQIGETLLDAGIPGSAYSAVPGLLDLPTSGLVRFQTFIPMQKEPEEEPGISNRDNDCDDTPCSSGNGR
jgi:hypothetical protein